jgi:Reverse transcriptase (RNA-dependent DNA polymerase)
VISVVFNKIACTVDDVQICRPTMVLLDLSAAFDSWDHGIFMYVQEERCAYHDEVKDWFHSYLSGRTRVYYVWPSSVSTRLMCGVPQGSIISPSPSQFTAYTEDVKDVVSPMSHHLYADDKQMLAKATMQSLMQSLGTCCQKLKTRISSLQHWCAARRLQLNPDSTESIYFASHGHSGVKI